MRIYICFHINKGHIVDTGTFQCYLSESRAKKWVKDRKNTIERRNGITNFDDVFYGEGKLLGL